MMKNLDRILDGKILIEFLMKNLDRILDETLVLRPESIGGTYTLWSLTERTL